jgi:hypothetical protein
LRYGCNPQIMLATDGEGAAALQYQLLVVPVQVPRRVSVPVQTALLQGRHW